MAKKIKLCNAVLQKEECGAGAGGVSALKLQMSPASDFRMHYSKCLRSLESGVGFLQISSFLPCDGLLKRPCSVHRLRKGRLNIAHKVLMP